MTTKEQIHYLEKAILDLEDAKKFADTNQAGCDKYHGHWVEIKTAISYRLFDLNEQLEEQKYRLLIGFTTY